MDQPAERVGDVVRRLREQRGESLRDVAHRAAISPIQLSRIERLEASPTEEKIRELAAAYGVSPSALFEAGESHVRPASGATGDWLGAPIAEWERLVGAFQNPAIPEANRRAVAGKAAQALGELAATLGMIEFYGELQHAWSGERALNAQLTACREVFKRHRPREPEAAHVYPRYRYMVMYRDDGLCECRYEFSLANIGVTPIRFYENWASGDESIDESEMDLHISSPSGRPVAEPRWLERDGNTVGWRAELAQPIKPGEVREIVESWIWPYPRPITRDRLNKFVVDAFMGELEIQFKFPERYVPALAQAWEWRADGTGQDVPVTISSDRPPAFSLKCHLPDYDGSGSYTWIVLKVQVVPSSVPNGTPASAFNLNERR